MILLLHNFIKRYETADFSNKLVTVRQFCEQTRIHFLGPLSGASTPTGLTNYNGRPLRVEI